MLVQTEYLSCLFQFVFLDLNLLNFFSRWCQKVITNKSGTEGFSKRCDSSTGTRTSDVKILATFPAIREAIDRTCCKVICSKIVAGHIAHRILLMCHFMVSQPLRGDFGQYESPHSPSDVAGADRLTIHFAGIWQLLASQRFPGAIFVFRGNSLQMCFFYIFFFCIIVFGLNVKPTSVSMNVMLIFVQQKLEQNVR